VIVALTDQGEAVSLCRHFRRRGWDVYQANTESEAHRLAHLLDADLLLTDSSTPLLAALHQSQEDTHDAESH
jgi:DNA-binding response OmpR family regulator